MREFSKNNLYKGFCSGRDTLKISFEAKCILDFFLQSGAIAICMSSWFCNVKQIGKFFLKKNLKIHGKLDVSPSRFYRASDAREAHSVFRDIIGNYTSDDPPWDELTLENYKGTAIYKKGLYINDVILKGIFGKYYCICFSFAGFLRRKDGCQHSLRRMGGIRGKKTHFFTNKSITHKKSNDFIT